MLMPEEMLAGGRLISAKMVLEALHMVAFRAGGTVEQLEPECDWPRLCGRNCQFPRYFRDGKPNGLVAHVLVELGYPTGLLKELDVEYEMSEVLHPGVKIGRSRNPALLRIDRSGRRLLSFMQERQKLGRSWNQLSVEAIKPRLMIPYLDARRRPWLY